MHYLGSRFGMEIGYTPTVIYITTLLMIILIPRRLAASFLFNS